MFCFGEKTVWQWQDTSKKELGLQNLRGCCLGWLGLARIRAGCTAPSLTERFCKKILRKLWQKSACIQKSDCIYNCCDQPWMGSLEGWGGVSRSPALSKLRVAGKNFCFVDGQKAGNWTKTAQKSVFFLRKSAQKSHFLEFFEHFWFGKQQIYHNGQHARSEGRKHFFCSPCSY